MRNSYTYAADFIRYASMDPNESLAQEITLSRAQASQIRQHIAAVLGIPDAELAEKLAAAYHKQVVIA